MDFGHPDFTIYNGGAFPANRYTSYMTSSTSIDVSLKHREMVILGTQVGRKGGRGAGVGSLGGGIGGWARQQILC